jgi:hypothetical protein
MKSMLRPVRETAAERLVEHDVLALGPERYPDGARELVHPRLQRPAGVELQLLVRHGGTFPPLAQTPLSVVRGAPDLRRPRL